MRTIQVIDTHTAGHPTRAILGGLPPLLGNTVRERRDDFRDRFDALRPQLLHEPRGHAAMVGAILTASQVADFGAFFISSYVYLDMCGHATIGIARTLAATGQIDVDAGPTQFSLETPAGVITVDVASEGGAGIDASILNVPASVELPNVTIDVPDLGTVDLTIAYCGGRFGLVDATPRNWPLRSDTVGKMCLAGSAIKYAANAVLDKPIGSVLFYRDLAANRARHLVVLESNKFDRSPCGTGTSARLASLNAEGRLGVGDTFIAESVLGTEYQCTIESASTEDGNNCVQPRIAGQAFLSAFSTLVVEEGDPLAGGFLCR